jgi:uncharacterized protein (TIGR02246 family)
MRSLSQATVYYQEGSTTVKKMRCALALGVLSLGAAMLATADPLTPQDYTEIEQLYAKYNDTIDHNDPEGYASTFTVDGVFNNNTGREALTNFVKQWHERMHGGMRRHWNTNLRISGDSKQATGSVYLMLVDLSTQPASIVMTGTYADTLVKTSQGWRFSKRATKRDTPAVAGGHL